MGDTLSCVCGVILLFKEIAPSKKVETESNLSPTKHDEKEKVDTPEASGPSAVQSPGAEGNVDFVKYTCDTRKTAMKEGNIITISSVTHARVRIDGFTSGRNMLGKQNILCCDEGLMQHNQT